MIWPDFDVEHLLVSSEQMSCLEEALLSGGMPVSSLMEKVGQGMVSWLEKQPFLIEKGVQVLVGPGHNGGDGLVVARELHLRGINLEIWCPFPIKAALTKQHLEYCLWLGIRQLDQPPDVSSEALWIDAIFGLGQVRPLPVFIANLFKARENSQPGKLVSLDVPTGICSDSGKTLSSGAAVALATLTVGLKKQGLVQDLAIKNVGKLKTIEIGLPKALLNTLPKTQPRLILSSDLASSPWPQIDPDAMKYQRGRVLIIAGSDRYKGAAYLALRGVMASGAGSVSGFFPEKIASDLWKVIPEVVVQGSLSSSSECFLELGQLLSEFDFSRVDAILIGPGLGNFEKCFSFWEKPLRNFKGLVVLDADAINQIADSSQGYKWLAKREGPTWLTPHLEEFYRLFPSIDTSNKLKAASEAAKITGTGVLFKGAHSLVASPKGEIWQLEDTFHWSARCGFGDLLAGFSVGLGAIGVASSNQLDDELLALSMFLHAEAAKISEKGAGAALVAESLSKITRALQSQDVAFST